MGRLWGTPHPSRPTGSGPTAASLTSTILAAYEAWRQDPRTNTGSVYISNKRGAVKLRFEITGNVTASVARDAACSVVQQLGGTFREVQGVISITLG